MTDETIRRQPQVYVVETVQKADTQMVAGTPFSYEDQFDTLYFSETNQQGIALMPPYNPTKLKQIAHENNTLLQCVQCMEVNVDGTGYVVTPRNPDDSSNAKEEDTLESFFDTPFPNETWISIRRKIRNDLETTGNAYLEVLRTLDGTIAMLRYQETDFMRLCRLSEPRLVDKTVIRAGKPVTLKLWMRERAFVQIIGMRKVYYREFGASRGLNSSTGVWADGSLPMDVSATEIIHFKASPGVGTPYGIPRWENNLPAALGSRKAEILNLEYFDTGGLPPAIVLVEGGILAEEVATALKAYLSGTASSKQRAVVVEALSNTGTLDSAGQIRIRVERFGASASDALFMKYDVSTQDRMRLSFRLPPLFLGDTVGHNFATAEASYLLAENQVFAPERDAFDAMVDRMVLRSMGMETMTVKSKPISIRDVTQQLAAMGMVKDIVDGENLVHSVNTAVDLELKYKEPEPVPSTLPGAPKPGQPAAQPGQPAPGADKNPPQGNGKDGEQKLSVDDLVEHVLRLQGLSDEAPEYSDSDVAQLLKSLEPEDLMVFRQKLSEKTYGPVVKNAKGLMDLTGCVAAFLYSN